MSGLEREGASGFEVDTINVCDEVSGLIIRIGLGAYFKEVEITWRVVDLPAKETSSE